MPDAVKQVGMYIDSLLRKNPLPKNYFTQLSQRALAKVRHLKPAKNSKNHHHTQDFSHVIHAFCERLAKNPQLSTLDLIKENAQKILHSGEANNIEKSIVVFQFILDNLIETKMATFECSVPLELLAFNNDHSVVAVQHALICDPWVDRCYSLDKLAELREKDKHEKWGLYTNDMSCIFRIGHDWNCLSGFNNNRSVTSDIRSMKKTYHFFSSLQEEPEGLNHQSTPQPSSNK